jgi:hypothetical protein
MVTWIVLLALLFIHLESTLVQLALTRLGDCGTSLLEQNFYFKKGTAEVCMELAFTQTVLWLHLVGLMHMLEFGI